MWRSVFSAWLFGSRLGEELSPWVHAFELCRLEEQWERDPRHPTVFNLVELLHDADRLVEHAVARTYGWSSDARQQHTGLA